MFTLIQATAVSDRWGTAGFGRLNGVMLAPVMLSSALAPWLGSELADLTGSHARAFLVLTTFAVVAVALLPWSQPAAAARPRGRVEPDGATVASPSRKDH